VFHCARSAIEDAKHDDTAETAQRCNISWRKSKGHPAAVAAGRKAALQLSSMIEKERS